VASVKDAWPKLTDLLSAKLVCSTTQQAIDAIHALSSNQKAKILNIAPRFGSKFKNTNDATVVFEF